MIVLALVASGSTVLSETHDEEHARFVVSSDSPSHQSLSNSLNILNRRRQKRFLLEFNPINLDSATRLKIGSFTISRKTM